MELFKFFRYRIVAAFSTLVTVCSTSGSIYPLNVVDKHDNSFSSTMYEQLKVRYGDKGATNVPAAPLFFYEPTQQKREHCWSYETSAKMKS